MTDRVGLLVFHRNDVEGAIRVIDAVGAGVDERLVIDSSGPAEFADLERRLAGRSTQVTRVLPLGCTEPLRPYAHAKLRSEVVVSIDTDEVPTAGLVRRLRALPAAAAWRVLRQERTIGASTRLVRAYRRGTAQYEGWIHEAPKITGPTVDLAPEEGLDHWADYPRYLSDYGGSREYPVIESIERPPTGNQLRSELGGRGARVLLPADDRPVAVGRLRLLTALSFFFPYRGESGLAGQLRNRRWFGRYLVARARAWARLPASEKAECLSVASELRRSGGPIPYLGFDDPSYVDRLTATFEWSRGGSATLVDLLRFRHRVGRPRVDFTEPLPEPRADGAGS